MVDMTSISSAVLSLKAATDIAKSLMDLKASSAIQGRVIELQAEILAAQSSALAAQSDQFSLLQRIGELETDMAELEAWNAEQKRYKLTNFGGGTFAYELKPEEALGEPAHRICANCYQKRTRSILQSHGTTYGMQELMFCPECKTEFRLGVLRDPDLA